MIHLSSILKSELPHLESTMNIYRMLTWEGVTFFSLLIMLSITIVYLFTRDLNKSKSMQNFFGLMAHEIKNPLAAIQVQAEALLEEKEVSKIAILSERLRVATQTFSHFINNVLQLSSIELGDRISLTSLPLGRLLNSMLKWMPKDLQGDIKAETKVELKNIHILGDVRAFEIIFNNLINNIHQHSLNAQKCLISIHELNNQTIIVRITDNGEGIDQPTFERLLGRLDQRNFSKKNGFGLYLVKRLMELQKGQIRFKRIENHLVVELIFKTQRQG